MAGPRPAGPGQRLQNRPASLPLRPGRTRCARLAVADAHIGSMMRLRGPSGFEQRELLAGGGRVGNAPVRLE